MQIITAEKNTPEDINGVLNFRGGREWDIHYTLHNHTDDKTARPLVIKTEGYRSRGRGEESNRASVMSIVNGLDAAVLTFDYSGHDRESFWPDPATLKTNIDDTIAVTNHVMSQFGYARNVFAPKSAGINPALAAIDERTDAIVAGLPIPDFLLTISEPYLAAHPFKRLGLQAMFATVGVCHWKPSSNYTTVPSIKITRDFYESTKVHTVERILEENPTRVPVHLIGNKGDRFASPVILDGLQETLLRHGFKGTSLTLAEGQKHIFTEDTLEKINDALAPYF